MKIIQGEISETHDLDPKNFHVKYGRNRIPVVVHGLSSKWPCMSTWNLKYFRKYSDIDVYVAILKGGLSYPPNIQRSMNFGGFLDYIEISDPKKHQNEVLYLQQAHCDCFNELDADYTVPDLLSGDPDSFLGSNTLFIGSFNTRTTLHYDRPLVDNLFCQITGRKRFKLWTPESGCNFYPFSFDSIYSHVSQIPEINNVDLEQFPLFSKAQISAEIILEPGDSLYIPKGWWHQVSHMQEISISQNFWFY